VSAAVRTCFDLAVHIVATMWDLDRFATITPTQVRAQGSDVRAPAPDPADYM
jgi:hypothetical protein